MTLAQIAEAMTASIRAMTEEQRAELRRHVYEDLMGKPFRGAEFTLADEAFLHACGIYSSSRPPSRST